MDGDMRSAATPRWRGKAGRLEVWYATLSDPATRAGLWVHCETVAPLGAAWSLRPRLGHLVCTRRSTPHRAVRSRAHPARDRPLVFDAEGVRVGDRKLSGRAGSLAWDLSWNDTGAPLWTFPRGAWDRELLPGAQVVLAPTADFTGSLTIDDSRPRASRGGAAASPTSTGTATPNAGAGSTPTSATATCARRSPLSRTSRGCAGWPRWRSFGSASTERIGPQAHCRRCGCGRRSACSTGSWRDASAVAEVLIRIDQPPDRCVSLQYTDPDGGRAVCTNTEQADIHIEIDERRWSVLGTGHAEVGLRGPAAPDVNERIPT